MQNRKQTAIQFVQSTSALSGKGLVLMCSFLFVSLLVNAQNSILENRYTFEAKRTSLYDALNIISQKTGYFFIYDSKILESDKSVKLEARGEKLEYILKDILNDPKLGFRVLSKHILIFEVKENAAAAYRKEPARQDSAATISVKGKVFDEVSRKPLQYVSVAIEGTSEGTITNGEGYFILKLPRSHEQCNVRISHIGYKPYSFPIMLVRDQKIDLYLKSDIVSLQEIVIRRVDPVEIVANAIKNRKKNYSSTPYCLTTFYREGVLKDGNYLNYAEAIFKVYKPALDQFLGVEQVSEVKSRKIVNTDQSDTLFMKLKGGISTCLSLDIAKSIPDFLELSEIARYRYTLSDMVSYESHNAYAINFVQKADVDDPLFTGTMYIDADSLAILGAEFEINPAYISKAADYLITKNSKKHIVKPERFTYSVTYRKVGEYYYINHAKCDMQLKVRKKGRLFSNTYSAFLEMATCNIDTKNVSRFDKQKTIRPHVVFLDLPYTYDPDFWGDFNYIVPEERLNEALKRINTKIEKIE
jgi:hypothetical protein